MKKILKTLIFVSSLIATVCSALDTDRDQIAHLKADAADINHKTGMSYYHGHVMFVQGTTHITADEAIIQVDSKNQLIKAVAISKGSQLATYETLPKKEDKILYAKARTITWYAQQKKIKLSGDARIEQGKNSFTAPEIDYDTVQQHVISAPSKNGKTIIRVYPEKTAHGNIASKTFS